MDLTAITAAVDGTVAQLTTVFGAVVLVIVAIFSIRKIYGMITRS